MKNIYTVLSGIGLCAAVATGVFLSKDEAADDAQSSQPMTPALSAHATSPNQVSSLWTWGNLGASATNEPFDVLWVRALTPQNQHVEGDDVREKLSKLVKEDPVAMNQLMSRYDKEPNLQARQLIVSLLSNVEKPEVLAFSKRLASSADMTQRKDGLSMLQNLSSDLPEVHPIILQTLAKEKTPEVIMLALSALKPPASAENNITKETATDTAAIVAQLQNLTRNDAPNIRLQSILQLAQWDKADSSAIQWSQALVDRSPQVRQAAVTAIGQSGTQSDTVKAALIGVASNPNESNDVRGSALQVLERFTLSKDETANYSQLRSEVLGL